MSRRAHPPRPKTNKPQSTGPKAPVGTSRLEWQLFLQLGGRPSTPEEWERLLASENMPANIAKVPDPAGPGRLPLPEENAELTRWPRRAGPDDPSIGPTLADHRAAWAARAFTLPGFFRGKYRGGRRKNPQRGEIWRLVMLEGRRHREVAAITGRTPNAVRLVIQQVRRRLVARIGKP